MHTITIKLIPARLSNPDLDIRYVLPNLIVEKSGGRIAEDGYDYENGSDALLIYLLAEDVDEALTCITDVLTNTLVLGNDLSNSAEVTVECRDF